MAEKQTYNPYTLADIERYLQGKMSAAEMHAMEKAALEDPFLGDAIEGYSQAPFTVSHKNLDSIAAALAANKEDAKIIAMPVKRRGWVAAAAAILVVAATGIVAMLVFKSPKNENAVIAQQNAVPVAVDTNASSKLAETSPPAAASEKVVAQKVAPAKDKTVTREQLKLITSLPISPAARQNRVKADSIKATDDAGLVANKAIDPLLNNNLANNGPAYRQNNNYIPPAPKADSTIAAYDLNKNGYLANVAVQPKAEAFARKKGSGLTIQLSPLPGFDSTITVTQLNNKIRQHTISTDTSLLPQGGWETFREYVARQQHKEVDTTETAFDMEGDVELEFAVDERGLAKEIKVTRSLNAESDKQAIEFVKNWPAWITTKNHKGKVVIQF